MGNPMPNQDIMPPEGSEAHDQTMRELAERVMKLPRSQQEIIEQFIMSVLYKQARRSPGEDVSLS